MRVTKLLAEFAATARYEDLPSEAVRETRRLIMDTIGCALGGIRTEKGELALRLATALGGPEEASLMPAGKKASASSAAYALGELMNALDYEALLSPPEHATPYVLAAPIAVGEMKKSSGKELVLATAVAHEITTRLAVSLVFGRRFSVELPDEGVSLTLPTPGYGLCVFGGAAAAGRLWGLGAGEIADAMGIAGYMAPLPMLMKFAVTVPSAMPKYLSAGALSQLEVQSVLSASMGTSGDREVLDGNYGFWRSFGCEGWRPEAITEGLGKTWHFPGRLFYKFFPCCGAMQNGLMHFRNLLIEHAIGADEIDRVQVRLNPLAELPIWKAEKVVNHIDAQFNVPFVFSTLANGIEIGPLWQDASTLKNKKIRDFMKKVEVFTGLNEEDRFRPDVEVKLGPEREGKSLRANGYALPSAMTDKALEEKFVRNARVGLGQKKAETLAQAFMAIEEFRDISEILALMRG